MNITYPIIEEYAQEQAGIYENFLEALQAVSLSFKAANAEFTQRDRNEAEKVFNEKARLTMKLIGERTVALLEPLIDVEEDVYFSWVGDIEELIYKTQERCLLANKAKFISSMRFGGAFDGLGEYFSNYGGAMGLLVQKKAQKINWTYRAGDGRSLSCAKSLYSLYRLLAVRATAMRFLLEHRLDPRQVVLCDKEGNELHKGTAESFLLNEGIIEQYFHYNSECCFAISP